jgi:ABC-type bacteriocin/lantibiotic exporter with double-glycine peptidase domain
MILPRANQLLFGRVLNSGMPTMLLAAGAALLCVTVSLALINITSRLLTARVQSRLDIAVQSATMMRVMALPPAFFKQFAAGDLSSRTQAMNSLCTSMANAVLTTGLSSVFSLAYIGQIFAFAPALVAPALVIVFATVLFMLITTLVQMRETKKALKADAAADGLVFSLISGVAKLKVTGAERRAFFKWARAYSEVAKTRFDAPLLLKANGAIGLIISSVGMIWLYYAAIAAGVSAADYMAFNAAYSMLSGAFISLLGIVTTVAQVKPQLDMVRPILDTAPEAAEDKRILTGISGGIELSHVSFKYAEDAPPVIDDLSLKVRPGQYIGIVGRTGCGKSTLIRLLLGFERAQKGAVYYDGHDMGDIDLRYLRHNLGVVTQDGKLFAGDIFSNITIGAPHLNMDAAWEAAELAGIADDIREMPMGMHTVISEGAGGISGGQKQRLMIARAIAARPKVLLFDEATSALDNITQKKVAASLASLKCTRIVVAHRLSTIIDCDRILVMDNGRIVEDGTYGQLVEQDGIFAGLVARQLS